MTVVLRESYDVGTTLSEDPIVVVIEDFLSAGECAHLIECARPKMRRGRVTLDDELAYSDGRTNSNGWVGHEDTPVVRAVVDRVSELVGVSAAHAESIQVVHYAQGQEYGAHFDTWKVGTERHANLTVNGGQRLVTALMYLSDVEAGGATGFPRLDLEVEPRRGRLVLFHNTSGSDHDVNRGSLHGGRPVELGDKWACNLWFRERPYNRSRGQRR